MIYVVARKKNLTTSQADIRQEYKRKLKLNGDAYPKERIQHL